MTVEHASIRLLAEELGMVPQELRKELRPKLRAGAQHIVSDMKSRASYSTRIPGSIRMSVSFAGRGRGGVTIRANSKRAPHARVLERGNHGGRADAFRHPVFGDRDVWVTQPTRPFFFPAVRAGRDQLRDRISEAVSASFRRITR